MAFRLPPLRQPAADRGYPAGPLPPPDAGLDPSHVLLALGRPHEVAHGSLRLSLSHENRPEEIDYILEVLPGIVSYLRGMSPVWDELETGLRPHLI